MAFPQTPLDLRVELLLGSTWTDITSPTDYVYGRDPAITTRGRSSEASQISPAAWNGTLNNRDGRFSSRNPTGAYYGLLGLGTPLRWSVPLASGQPKYLRLEDDSASYASCPDSAGLHITGDLEIQADIELSGISTAVLAAKWLGSTQRSWILALTTGGEVQLFWSADGSGILAATSTAPLPLATPGAVPGRRVAVKATLSVNNGAGGNTVTFWTSTSLAGSWAQLGDPVVQAGTTSVFASTASVGMGDYATGGTSGMTGKAYGLRVISGIGGTVKASPDFTAQAAGTTSFTDAQSNTWTLQGTAAISDRDYRFHGELSSLPPRWDSTGKDAYVPVTASGLWQRASAGGQLSGSVMYRAATRLTGPFAVQEYWPCEDLAGSSQIASGTGGPPLILTGAPTLASDSSFACSSAIPVLNSSTWTGTVRSYSGETDAVLRFLMHVPAAGDTNNGIIALFETTGTVNELQLHYGTGGTLQLVGFDSTHTSIFDSGLGAFVVNGGLLRVSMELKKNGAGLDWAITTLQVGASTGGSFTGNLASATVGRITKVIVNRDANLVGTALGHVTVQKTWETLFDLSGAMTAYNGETAATRFGRLCAEEGYQCRVWGYQDQSVAMGPQPAGAFSALLQECETADMGMIFEPRESLSLGYRPLSSLVNQAAVVTANYSSAALAGPLDPADDLQRVANDVTASRLSGSSSRQVLSTGALSVQAPPNGVNPRPGSFTANVAYDSQLDDEAGWAVHMGTVNELRYPVMTFNLARSATPAGVRDADMGDYLALTGTTSLFPPGDVKQLMEGVTEVAGSYTWTIAPALAPESPYETGIVGDTVQGRSDADGTTLHAGITSAATSLQQDGDTWTTTAGDFPFDVTIGGEQVTVTNITGASAPQTWTVTRSVNGVVKAHVTGEAISLTHPAIVALT